MTTLEGRLNLMPVTLRQAQAFVDNNHRHNSAPRGHKFSIGIEKDGALIGVCIVGRPVARGCDDGQTAEVLRVCVLEGNPNANSKLYGAAARACKAMGYVKVITYTLPEEGGASLRASGFVAEGETRSRPKGWNTPGRPRTMPERYPEGKKIRWVRYLKGETK